MTVSGDDRRYCRLSSANLSKARSAGFDGFLAKPLNVDLFPDQIRRILDGEAVWDLG